MAKIKRIGRESDSARAVANDVIAEVVKGRKPSISKIALKHGYSPSVARNPKKIRKTKSYQDVMVPFEQKLLLIRDRFANELLRKARRIDQTDPAKLSVVIKNSVHDYQLLTGGKTENTGIDALSDSINELIKKVS